MLIGTVPIDLHKLLEDGRPASRAFDGKAGGIMKVTKHVSSMFVIGVLRPKDRRAHRTCKVLYVKLHVWSTMAK
jgi:hypothetical protein